MAASLRAGLAAVEARADAVVVLLADMPEVGAAEIDRLIAAFDPAEGREIVRAVSADGRPGHPVLFGRRFFEDLRGLAGDQGARSILAAAADFVVEVPTAGDGRARRPRHPRGLGRLARRRAPDNPLAGSPAARIHPGPWRARTGNPAASSRRSARRRAAPAPRRAGAPPRLAPRRSPLWLAVLFALVVAMIAVGGLTRLTESGLSITEWRPVTGAIPPLDEAAWTAEFEKYRASPQYAEVNARHDPRRVPDASTGGNGATARSAASSAWSGPPASSCFWLTPPPAARAGRRGCSRSAPSAACRARSAGGWSAPASSPAWSRSPRPASPSTSASPSCCSG